MAKIAVKKQESPMQTIAKRMNTALLTRGRVVVIGAGGVGSCLLPPLATFLSALGSEGKKTTLVVADGDHFSPGNVYRVDIPERGNKAEAWAGSLSERFNRLDVRAVPQYITKDNQAKVIREGDVVFLCCDNHATRKLVSDRVSRLKHGVLISGGNDGVNDETDGTAGNTQILVREAGKVSHGSPLDKFHPEIAKPADKNPEELNCLEAAQQGEAQLGFANLAVASAMCNGLTRLLMLPKGQRMYDECIFDIKEGVATAAYLSGPKAEVKKRK